MWQQKNNFLFHPMHYQNSCFPTCLSMILRNSGIGMNEFIIEDEWESLQTANPPNVSMKDGAPTIHEIERNLLRTVPGDHSFQVLGAATSHSLSDANIETIRQHISQNPAGFIIAAQVSGGHAQLIFHRPQGYVHLYPVYQDFALQVEGITFLTNIDIQPFASDGGQDIVVVDVTDNNRVLCGGDFVVLL